MLDPALIVFLTQIQVDSLTFCHRQASNHAWELFRRLATHLLVFRWILLCFKREFSHEDGVRCFEMLSARDLEFSTFEANKHQHTQMKTETAKSGQSECALKITIQM